MSGAGDEVSTVVASLQVSVRLEGMGESFALSDSTIFITKNAAGHSIAMAAVVNSRLRKLFTTSDVSATAAAMGELSAEVAVGRVSVSAYTESDAEVTVTLETVEMQRKVA